MNQEKIEDLLNKVMDIKQDTQQVLDEISSMESAYEEQTGREQALEAEVAELNKHVEFYTKKYNELAQQKEASSAPCGCQAYRDLEEKVATMPVIPKAVAIAIFREGVSCGVDYACDEIDNSDSVVIEDSGYTGGFEVSFSKYVDLTEHIDTEWMRGKVGDYEESNAIATLRGLCKTKGFECRIHGVDDQEEKKNEG